MKNQPVLPEAEAEAEAAPVDSEDSS